VPAALSSTVRRQEGTALTRYIHIGGLVAAGFDPTGQHLLTVSHAGRGVFAASNWERVARDAVLAYPSNGRAVGIGPIEGISIPVAEIDNATGILKFESPDGATVFEYESGMLEVVASKMPLNKSLEQRRER
jgi:hypothetical protein